MALRVRVCALDAVAPGEIKAFSVAGISVPVMITRIDDEWLATTSMCPHEDVSLCDGRRDGNWIVCPGHGYEFDLTTGECSHDPRLSLARYKVTIEEDQVYVDLVGL